MGGPAFPERCREIIGEGLRLDAHAFGDAVGSPADGGGEDEVVDGAGLDPGLTEDRLHRLRDDLADAFVPNQRSSQV